MCTLDTQIKRSGLRISHSKVFSSVNIMFDSLNMWFRFYKKQTKQKKTCWRIKVRSCQKGSNLLILQPPGYIYIQKKNQFFFSKLFHEFKIIFVLQDPDDGRLLEDCCSAAEICCLQTISRCSTLRIVQLQYSASK